MISVQVSCYSYYSNSNLDYNGLPSENHTLLYFLFHFLPNNHFFQVKVIPCYCNGKRETNADFSAVINVDFSAVINVVVFSQKTPKYLPTGLLLLEV